jgi:hypothetical protein
VRVYQFSSNTNYNLAINPTFTDFAGNSLAAARNVGALAGTQSFSDFVGSLRHQ